MTARSNAGASVRGVRVLQGTAGPAMRAFGRLPQRLRRALNYAPIDIAPQSVLAHLRRGRSPLLLVRSIKDMARSAFAGQRRALDELTP